MRLVVLEPVRGNNENSHCGTINGHPLQWKRRCCSHSRQRSQKNLWVINTRIYGTIDSHLHWYNYYRRYLNHEFLQIGASFQGALYRNSDNSIWMGRVMGRGDCRSLTHVPSNPWYTKRGWPHNVEWEWVCSGGAGSVHAVTIDQKWGSQHQLSNAFRWEHQLVVLLWSRFG